MSAVSDREVVGNDVDEVLARMRAYRMAAAELEHRADVVAAIARMDHGLSWGRIGGAMGLSQQGAQHRFTSPGAPGFETWRGLGWVDLDPSLPTPRVDVVDAAVMGLDLA